MKVSLIQENLAKALIYINKAVSSRPNIPVLANVLLETEKGKLKLSATNLDIGISTWIGATVEEEGKMTVSARMLSDFVNTLKPGKIEMFQQSQTLVVKSVDNKAEFYVIPAEDFPQVPEKEGKAVLTIAGHKFARAIHKTVFAAGTDESRPALTGLLMIAKDDQLTLVGVDGFRLSRKVIDLEKAVLTKDLNEVVPAKALSEVEKLITDILKEDDQVEVYLLGNKNQLLFKVGEVELSTRLIEGKFPEYEQIIPKESKIDFAANKKEFSDMLKVVSIFSRNVIGNKTRFKVDTIKSKLTLSTEVTDIGSNESSINLKNVEGEDIETAFNVKFLQDMINVVEGESVLFQKNEENSPGVFFDPKDDEFIHLIMPMGLD